jgi:hypothetical protein
MLIVRLLRYSSRIHGGSGGRASPDFCPGRADWPFLCRIPKFRDTQAPLQAPLKGRDKTTNAGR